MHAVERREIVAAELEKWTASEILQRLLSNDVPSAPVLSRFELLQDRQVRENHILEEFQSETFGKVRMPRPAALSIVLRPVSACWRRCLARTTRPSCASWATAAMRSRAWNAAASFKVDLLIRPQSNSANHASLEMEEEIPMSDTKPVVIVTGVGPGTGAAIVRRFAHGGYAVAMLARNRDRLTMLEREISGAHAYQCDVTDEAQLDATIEAVRAGLGAPKVLIHNAVGGAFGNFMQIDPEVLNRNFQVNTMALLHLARRLAPAMVAAAKARSSPAATPLRCAAKRALPVSRRPRRRSGFWRNRSRASWPKGRARRLRLIDAVIDLAWTRKRWPDAPDAFFIKPAAIAEEIWHVAHQDRSAWSFNVEIRPFGETW